MAHPKEAAWAPAVPRSAEPLLKGTTQETPEFDPQIVSGNLFIRLSPKDEEETDFILVALGVPIIFPSKV